jgi:hypothetical protein
LAGLLIGGALAVFVGTLLPEQSGFADSERWGTYLAIYIAMWVVMARLERLGKQLEAVASVVREEIATSAERKQESLTSGVTSGSRRPKMRVASGLFGE